MFANSPVSSAYGELGHSLKVNLTYAPDNIDIKEKLIKEAVVKKYTVAGLRKRIVEERRLLDKDYISLEEPISEEKLKSFDNDKLIKFQKKIEKDKTELQKNINELNAKIALYTANISSIATQIALKVQEEANTAAQQVQTNIVSTEHPAV